MALNKFWERFSTRQVEGALLFISNGTKGSRTSSSQWIKKFSILKISSPQSRTLLSTIPNKHTKHTKPGPIGPFVKGKLKANANQIKVRMRLLFVSQNGFCLSNGGRILKWKKSISSEFSSNRWSRWIFRQSLSLWNPLESAVWLKSQNWTQWDSVGDVQQIAGCSTVVNYYRLQFAEESHNR